MVQRHVVEHLLQCFIAVMVRLNDGPIGRWPCAVISPRGFMNLSCTRAAAQNWGIQDVPHFLTLGTEPEESQNTENKRHRRQARHWLSPWKHLGVFVPLRSTSRYSDVHILKHLEQKNRILFIQRLDSDVLKCFQKKTSVQAKRGNKTRTQGICTTWKIWHSNALITRLQANLGGRMNAKTPSKGRAFFPI